MGFFTLSSQGCSAAEFVSFWTKCYGAGNYSESEYEKSLNKQGPLTPANIQILFEWKNNKRLSMKKQAIVNRLKSQVDALNAFRHLSKVSSEEFYAFWSFVSSIIESGIVYRVFVLHMARPDDYPIVDQHVLRAWNYLTKKRVEEPEQTLDNYKKYSVFFFELAKQSGKDLRSVDQALMAFGQFLNSGFFHVS